MPRIVMQGLRSLAVVLVVSALVQQASAYEPDGRALYAPCVVCHGPGAWGSSDGLIPNLAGQQRRYLEHTLGLFRNGARVDDAMQVVTAHPALKDPKNLGALSAYLAALEWTPKPLQGAGEHLRVGLEIFAHICAGCHGADGRGDALNRVPRIAGQHYSYLRKQIEAAANLHKELAPPEMTSALRSMHTQEKDALADYVSRLGSTEPNLDLFSPEPVQPH